MITIEMGSLVRCNKCSEPFEAPRELPREKFYGQAAARIQDQFCTCPHCNQTDVHWVHASDIMPEGLNPEQQRSWKRHN